MMIEKFLRAVTLHPIFKNLQMLGIGANVVHWHLMSPPCIFDGLAINKLRPRPSFGGAHDNHWPSRQGSVSVLSRFTLNGANFGNNLVERARHQLMHELRFVAFDEIRLPTVASEQMRKLLVAQSSKNRGIGYFVAVQVQYRQHDTVARRIEKFVRMPTRRQRPGFRFAIADDAAH